MTVDIDPLKNQRLNSRQSVSPRDAIVYALGIAQHLPCGNMKALAFATAKRTSLAPRVPTMAEAGVPGFEVNVWYGPLAPKKIPGPIIERLSSEVTPALQQLDVRERITGLASVPMQSTPEEFAATIKHDWTSGPGSFVATSLRPTV